MADLQRQVTKSGEVRWDVRYRDDARQQRKRSFERKLDAQRFARSVETDLLRGEWIDPRRGRELFEVWAAMWMETLESRKPKTRESYESIVHRHLLPRFAATPIAGIDYPCVLAFVARLHREGLGAGTVRNIRDVLRLVLGFAVRSGALKVNPVTDVEVSRTNRSEIIFLDPDQIMTLAEVCIGRPLVARFAADFCPLSPDVQERPAVVQLFRRLTYLWAGVNGVAAAATLTLLLTVPVAVFVGTAAVSTWIITCSGVVVTVSDSVRTARSEGLHTAVASNGRLHAYVALPTEVVSRLVDRGDVGPLQLPASHAR